MRLVIVTGMSGSGKQTAQKMMEDMGFYCVDNLPVPLIPKFVELMTEPGREMSKIVLGIDVRSGEAFEDVRKVLKELVQNGVKYEMLFMDASDTVLLKRYKETRRLHPLSPEGSVQDGISRERKILEEVKADSDYVIDTSNLLTRELKTELDRIFMKNEKYNNLMINIVSFGFKYGIPADADLIFDVRFLPNPFYIDELKNMTGNDEPVRDYVMSFKEAGEFLDKLDDMINFLIPNYIKEGKYQLVIGIGCTGGQHRSVTLANELYERLKNKGEYGLTIKHRDAKQQRV
ncbi:MAG: RNase adapter RapZ [Lachnospiraceae bacterium]|nr:RNase adapter RapZ [Lachnospiraceae bacterium]